MKKTLLMAMSAIMFLGCSKGHENVIDSNQDNLAYMALKLPTTANSRANSDVNGTPSESGMNDATVLLFDENEKCLGSVEFTAFTGKPSSEAKVVSAKTKKVFVVVNKSSKWNLANAEVINKTWSDINTYVAVTAADISTDDAFLMTNSGTLDKGALTDVTVHTTSAAALAEPAVIWVDRVTSKVILKTKSTNITVTPIGSTFEFKGWELNTTNKKTALYSERVPFTGTTTAVEAIYRRDNNYFKADFGATENDVITYIKDNYNWLTNGTSAADMSEVSRPVYVDDQTTATGKAYVTENTMEATAQLWGHTTKVVVKGQYTPSGITDKANYFAYKSKYYDVPTMKTEYIKANRTDLKADLVIFLKLAFPTGTTYGNLPDADKLLPANIDAAIDVLDNYSGIKAKYQAVTYYHQSVCYYDALINHDHTNATAMSLGRYGVVRNNAYELTINNVKGPGTPWIPDPTDPADPTDPNDPDDEVDANLSIDVKLNNWTYWSQGVDLGN